MFYTKQEAIGEKEKVMIWLKEIYGEGEARKH